MIFLTNLNLNKNQIQNALLHPLTAAPAGQGSAGQVYYNTTDKVLYVHDGDAWCAVGTATLTSATTAVITGIDEKGSPITTTVGNLTIGETTLGAVATKVDGIEAGAQKNVQSDWNATEGDALILNKPDIYTASEGSQLAGRVTALEGAIAGGLKYEPVDALPNLEEMTEAEFEAITNGTIYLVKKTDGQSPNEKDEFIFIKGEDAASSKFELIGDAEVSLDGYAKENELGEKISGQDISGAKLGNGENDPTIAGAISAIPVIKHAVGTIEPGEEEVEVALTNCTNVMSIIAKDGADIVYTDAKIGENKVTFTIADKWINAITCEVYYL